MSTIDEKSQLQTATARVQQVADHLRILPPPETFFSTPPTILPLSLIHGPKDQKLIAQSLGQALDDIAKLYPDNDALVCYSQGTRLAYATLRQRSRRLASQLLKVLDLQAGDRVGIFAGNESAYIELFFATARIGLILVVLNPTYTRSELVYALKHTGLLPSQRSSL
jgi:non-ribosomal peptide synthetase component F